MEDFKVNEQNLDSEDLTLETENIYGDDDDFVEQNIGLFINEVFSFNTNPTKGDEAPSKSELESALASITESDTKPVIIQKASNHGVLNGIITRQNSDQRTYGKLRQKFFREIATG